MDKIVSLLFENSEYIPNGLYLELMNEIKKLNDIKELNKEIIAKINKITLRSELVKFITYGHSDYSRENNDLKRLLKKIRY